MERVKAEAVAEAVKAAAVAVVKRSRLVAHWQSPRKHKKSLPTHL